MNRPIGRKLTARMIAAKMNDASQPTLSMICCITGTSTTPSEKPIAMIPTARPRLRSNQREISTWKGM